MTAPEPLVQVRRLEIRTAGSARALVSDVSLTLTRGRTLGIVGESGSGKTLTMKAVAGLLPRGVQVTGGTIEVLGQDVTSADDARWRELHRRHIGMVFQNPATALNPRMTVFAQIRESLADEDRGSRQADARRALELLAEAGIPDPRARLLQYPHELSGGLAQRVVIAIALARAPQIVIADEPTTALDVTTQATIMDLLQSLQRDRHLSMLLVSHDIDLVADHAQDVLVVRDGRRVSQGPTADVLREPEDEYTRTLVSSTPRALIARRWPAQEAARPGADPAADDAVLRAVEVTKRFTRPGASVLVRRSDRTLTALDGISLNVRRGEILGIVGESGSGKTTLSRLLVGLDRASTGTVVFDGADVTSMDRANRRRWRRDVQFVFQDSFASLNPRLTVEQSILEPTLTRPVRGGRSRAGATVDDLLARVGLDSGHRRRRPGSLSGGERQRAAIARALSVRPSVIVADEPVSALDVTVQRRILRLIESLNRDDGVTFVIVSHDLGVMSYLCHRVVVMHRGRIVETATPRELLTRPRHPHTRELVDAIPGTRARRSAGPAPAAVLVADDGAS